MAEESWSQRLERLAREEEQFVRESDRHEEERDRLDQEVIKLQQQLQQATDENTKKHLEDELRITQARREVADSKYQRVDALLWQRYYEQFGNVVSIRHWKKRAEEWWDKVKKNEEHLKKLESEKKKKREQYEAKPDQIQLTPNIVRVLK